MKGNVNVDNTKELKHISLCTGYGGIDLGLKRALTAVRTVCYVEIESYAIQNLVTKIEAGHLDAAPVWSNLKTFNWGLFSGKVDLLSGGFPCQPFSSAGRRKGSEDPRHLWPYIKDGIKRLGKPTFIFLENVEGIISSKLKGDEWEDPEGTPVLLHVLRELERMDYKATAGVFSASEVGAPHQRKRVFILAIRNELKQSGYHYVNGLVQSSETTEQRTMWPASRGESQHIWEPPRITLVGDPKHNGLLSSKECKDTNKASNDSPKGQSSTEQSKGASGPRGNESLQTSELGEPASKGPQGSTRPSKKNGGSRLTSAEQSSNEIEPPLGRNLNGATDRLDYEKLYESGDNRTDELRLLGNGVVPDTATRAFRILWRELADTPSKSTRGHSGNL